MLATNEIKPKVQAVLTGIRRANGPDWNPEGLNELADLVTSTLEAFHDLVWYIQQFESRDANRQ